MLQRRLIIVTGKGGVGRSAVSAALALRAVHMGKRVLAIAMTDDLGLALHLGRESLDYEAKEIRPGLHALAIHRPAALNEYLGVQLGVPKVTRMGPIARAFDALASTAPGIREVVTMGKVVWEVRKDTWDLVIADGPPLGQIGSHLRAPQTVTELVPVGKVRDQADWMIALLGDPSMSGLLLVTLAEELPVTETREALTWLEEHPVMEAPQVVANRMLPRLAATNREIKEEGRGPIREAALLHKALHEEQQRWLGELPPDRQLPFLFGLHTPPEVAARLADEWEED
ncbi:MAG: ArsA family ATPase [Acidimicrobiia bacterium]|nr:ArsA family ATPase [Acidimicrobiia bacterium]